MKKKYVKTLLLCLSLVTVLSSNCFAGENFNYDNSIILNSYDDATTYAKPATGFTWRIKSIKKDDHTSTKNNKWVLQYEGEPARRNGEYDAIQISTSYSHTYSGGFVLPALKSQAQSSLGYSYGTSKSFSATKNSASLKKGEYVRGYYKKNYSVSLVNQEELYFNTSAKPIYKPTGKTKQVKSYRAILPKIKLEYVTPKQKSNIYSKIVDETSIENYKVEKIEVYEPNEEGIYELSEVEIK
ncbi:hypothetical protein [Terrisporobacter petrolearius]|uniref:hypothetical protein n=1 Tax=Terrisporobacter petrolearius TaxID=1460447 RepID=UPI0031CCC08A